MYLRRYHDLQISHSGVRRALKRLDFTPPPASQRHKCHFRRWQHYEKPLPSHRVQIDVKFITPLSRSRRKHYLAGDLVDVDLDTLATAPYVKMDDLLQQAPQLVP